MNPVPETNRKLLIGYDGSEAANGALALGHALADATGFEPVIVSVVASADDFVSRAAMARTLARRRPGIYGGAREAIQIGVDSAGDSGRRAFRELAEKDDVAAIVLGPTHRGPLGRVYPGSLGVGLLSDTPCAVAIAPRARSGRRTNSLRSIGIAFDGSAESVTALFTGLRLARRTGGSVHLLAVAEISAWGSDNGFTALTAEPFSSHRRTELILDAAISEARDDFPGLEIDGKVLMGSVAEAIASAASDLDLLIAGSRGFGPVKRALFGATTARLARNTPVPLLVTPRGAGNDPLGLSTATTAQAA